MKKIGIMTMHRVPNYGSFLQAYGLKNTIEILGDYQVEFIDFKFSGAIVDNNKKNLVKKITSNLNVFDYFKARKYYSSFNSLYNNVFLKQLNVSEYNYNHSIDNLIIGSDEVFNVFQGYPVGFCKDLFGVGFDNCSVSSYAGSFGFSTYDMIKSYKLDEELSLYFKKFENVSVRDNNSFDIINKLGIKDVFINLDPVLISDYPVVERKEKIDNYIIIYAYPKRFTSLEEKMIKRFAKKYNKTIVSIGTYQRIADRVIMANPLEIFDYFKNADFVITDTFHGTIFSIKEEVNFCTIVRSSNNNKLTDLLLRLELNNRILTNINDLESLYLDKADFSKTNLIISDEKEKSKKYLKKCLK